jgi:hypothetical protein
MNYQISGTVILPWEWKFQKGDSSVYSNPGFNDQSWKSMRVDTFWEYQGFSFLSTRPSFKLWESDP